MKRQRMSSGIRKIEAYLKENGKINRKEAIELFDCWNLSSVIRLLREEGLDIVQKTKKRNGLNDYILVSKPASPVTEAKPEEFYAIVGFYKSTSGAISVHFDQTLFSSEAEADEYGSVARENDKEMIAYDVMQMSRLDKNNK